MTQAKDKALFNQNKRFIKANLPDSSPCPYCNSLMLKDTTHPYALVSIDHIIPYSKGGGDEIDNLKPCCGNCNTRKGNSNETLGFWLKEPKLLSKEEFIKLNDFTSVTNRLNVLKVIAEELRNNNYQAALLLAQQNENKNSHLGFFTKLVIHLKEIISKYTEAKDINYNCLAVTVIRIKSEADKLSRLTEELSYLSFELKNIKD